MENASKALIMAGSVLLALIVIASIVFLIGRVQNLPDTYTQKWDKIEIQKYNANFEVFIDREDITPQEIISILNFAEEKGNITDVVINPKIIDKNSFLATGTVNSTKYKCNYEDIEYGEDGKISEIKFIKAAE